MNQPLTLVELFAGTGSFSLAFQQLGVNPIFATDKSIASQKIYDANFPELKLTLKDIHKLHPKDIPSMDILTGGFPCQPFSIAGKRQGFNDERSNVFWKMIEIIQYHLPRCIILENVKNILTHDQGKTIEIIKSSLESIGYIVHIKLINTCIFTTIPQNRERVFFVCFRTSIPRQFDWGIDIEAKKQVSDFLESQVSSEFYYRPNSAIWDRLNQSVIDSNTVYQYRRTHVRENKSGVCPTLTANMGTGGHNVPIIKDSKGIRKLTPRECFNLQGFPQSYKIDNIGISKSALYTLAGNAITVEVVKKIAISALNYLE